MAIQRVTVFLVLMFAVAGSSLADEPTKAQGARRAALRAKVLAERGHELGKRTGSCRSGTASADLDINNVRARLYNTGGLFWRGGESVYTVPKTGRANAIFATNIWIGGLVDGELRMSASDYGPWEMWPGPLDENGDPPADCTQYDRMYRVSRSDVEEYEKTGVAAPDLAEWPYDLGAPVIDRDGNADNYNLKGGDRPLLYGDQVIWWVMNDMGNVHGWSLAQPIGIEVRVSAYAFAPSCHQFESGFGNMTFYGYEFVYKGGSTLTDAYIGIWSDPDLGDPRDDYAGSDTVRGIGFVWNGDGFDGGSAGYSDRPPSLGYDFLWGPLVNDDNLDNDRDGETDEWDERIAMTGFVSYTGDLSDSGHPTGGFDAYNYLRGRWRNGQRLTHGGNGRWGSSKAADFMYPADVSSGCARNELCFWSEENTDGTGSRNIPGDRRFLMSSGPFTLDPGEKMDIGFVVVWSNDADRYASVGKMKSDDALAQVFGNGLYDSIFPECLDPPRVDVAALDGTAILSWDYLPESTNYLDSYDAENYFLVDVAEATDKTYTFEGYQVLRYASESDLEGTVIATFDVAGNGVAQVTDISDANYDLPVAEVVVAGTDAGVKHSMVVQGLTNYRDYHFGVRAYAYNAFSAPRVIFSSTTRRRVRPSRPDARDGGTVVDMEHLGAEFTEASGTVTRDTRGHGTVAAVIVDPGSLTGDEYRVEFFKQSPVGGGEATGLTNYRIRDATEDRVAFDGEDAARSIGDVAPQSEDALVLDGLSWSVTGPEPSYLNIGEYPLTPAFVQTEGPNGPDEACGTGCCSIFGCAEVGGNFLYGSFSGQRDYIMWRTGGDGPEISIGAFAPSDFEIRFTESGSYAYQAFTSGAVHRVPYEVWDIGIVGPHGKNDPLDDIRLVPVSYSDSGGECAFGYGEIPEDEFGLGWPCTDRIYAYYASTTYTDWESAVRELVDNDPDQCPVLDASGDGRGLIDFDRGRPLQRIIFCGDPRHPYNYRDEGPATGNIIRFLTTKPNLPGDMFVVNTEGYGVVRNDGATARNALDLISVVPNPYKGVSDYETGGLRDEVRITNLPRDATIRVFTLSGALVKTIEKHGPGTAISWDLTTQVDLPLASGMYLVHVEAPGVGEKTIKFGVVKKQVHLGLY